MNAASRQDFVIATHAATSDTTTPASPGPASSALGRRALLGSGVGLSAWAFCRGLAGAAEEPATGQKTKSAPVASSQEPTVYCLNTSTIRGQNVSLPDEVKLAAKAGYGAIEPWINEIDKFVQDGGQLRDLARRISDLGLVVPSAIGFAEWIVDDDERRAKGLEEARRAMDLVAQLGGQRLAAPPVGATDTRGLDLLKAAERYRALVDLGESMGVIPQVELWGFSQTLSRVGETALVAVESARPRGCLLLDVYHIHKGGSDFQGVKLLSGSTLQVFHINDYPADPPRTEITDAHRVFPGDGVAPLGSLFRDLREIGFQGTLSLELFNREYWQRDAYQVACEGLEKMRLSVARALEA